MPVFNNNNDKRKKKYINSFVSPRTANSPHRFEPAVVFCNVVGVHSLINTRHFISRRNCVSRRMLTVLYIFRLYVFFFYQRQRRRRRITYTSLYHLHVDAVTTPWDPIISSNPLLFPYSLILVSYNKTLMKPNVDDTKRIRTTCVCIMYSAVLVYSSS